MERRKSASVPIWAVITLTVSILLSGGGTLAQALRGSASSENKVIENLVKTEKEKNDDQEMRIRALESLMERMTVIVENQQKILDRRNR